MAQGFGRRGTVTLGSSSTNTSNVGSTNISRKVAIVAGVALAFALLVARVVGRDPQPPPPVGIDADGYVQPTRSGTGKQLAAPTYPVVTPMTICKARYKLDYAMRDACMRNQEEAKGEAAVMQIDDDVKVLCAKRHIHDWTMYVACARRQMASKLPANDKPDRRRFDIVRRCQERWPNDYRMEEYCTRQQEEARSKAGGWIDHGIAVHCTEQWPADWNMFMYCVDNQTAARHRIR
jgi:hypothetical protein